MSLQLIAKQMEAKGRKGDSMLVHMTTGEVAGLQKLAETAGGSLSVNPETGLVEANFLKQMLPTLVGAGVGFFTANPMLGAAAGAAVGGYQANRAGRDVGEGMVMGGLGGYGGHTLSTGFQAAGAPVAAGAAGGGGSTATNMATNAMVNAALGGRPTPPITNPLFVDPATAQQQAMASVPLQMPSTAAGTGANASNVQVPASGIALPTPAAPMGFLDRAKSGFAGMENEAGRAAALKAMGGSEGLMRMLMMAGLPAMYGARTSVPHPYPLLSADVNKRGFADGGEVGFFTGGGTGQGNGLLGSLVDNRPYIIDPATGNVIRNPNLKVLAPAPAPTTFADMGGRGDGYTPNPDYDTPEKQAAFNRENPTMSNITRIGQEIFGMTPLGMIQNAAVPDFVAAQKALTDQAPAPVDTRTMAIDSPLGMGLRSTEYGAPSGISLDTPGTSLLDRVRADAEYERQQNAAMDAAVRDNIGLSNSAAASQQAGENDPGGDVGFSESATSQQSGENLASGGLLGLAKGGLKEGGFVVPADVVAFLGGGNSDNGAEKIERMFPNAMYIDGPDGGQEDTVKTSIEGKQPARVAHGEVYIPPQDVKRAGGAKVLYAMLDRVRVAATGSKKQIKPVSLERAMA